MARTYSCIDPQCKVVIERMSEEWSSDVRLIVTQGGQRLGQTLDPAMMLNIMSTLVYAYQAKTGEWPSLTKDRKMIVLDANKDDAAFMERCKDELNAQHGVASSIPQVRVRVRPVPVQPAPVSPPVFRTRTRRPTP